MAVSAPGERFVLIVPPQTVGGGLPTWDPSRAAAAMAAEFGGSPYDQRQVLLKNLPLATGWQSDTHVVAQRLAAAGLEAWSLPASALDTLPVAVEARSFRLTDAGLEAIAQGGVSLTLPWPSVELVLRARTEFQVNATTETTKKKTNLAAMAIGLPIGSKSTTVERNQTVGDTWFAVLCARRPNLVLRLTRDGLDYSGLGSAKGPGALVNYVTLLELVERRCPGARIDPRLEKAAGRIPPVPAEARRSVTKSGKTTVAEAVSNADNAEAVAFAGQLLWLAERLRRAGIAAGASL